MNDEQHPAGTEPPVPTEATDQSVMAPETGSAPPALTARRKPWVQMKYFSFHPCIYPAMLKGASRDATAGALVYVYDKDGYPFGAGLYNPKARVPLRVLHHGHGEFGEAQLNQLVERALGLRLDLLNLPATTDAFRVVHSDGDGLSGLAVDRIGDVLSIEIHSLGIAQRLPGWLPRMHERLGTTKVVIEVDPRIARFEGIDPRSLRSDEVRVVRLRENGIRYEVDFETGHKTGFFCDQRDNRRRLAAFTRGRRVLDLCCYSGGFSLSAKIPGEASEVTGVDLDEKAVEQARRNANLNQARISWVHCDAFSYARQMQRNRTRWDVVVLDPPKFILSRDDGGEGERKYEQLNALALSLVEPGGILVTCSCSGLLPSEEFERLVFKAAHRQRRRLQVFSQTGAAPDHPVMSNCPESRYLKVIWARIE